MKKILFLTTLVCSGLGAVQTQTLVDSGYGEFTKGKLKNVMLGNTGTLQTAPALTQLAQLDEPVVWAAAVDAKGNMFFGAGNKGVVVRVTPAGEVKTVFKPKEVLARAVAFDKKGRLYVGVSPSGRIYRLAEDGLPELFFSAPDSYVWDLIFDKEGSLHAATGDKAHVYKFAPDFKPGDQPEVWFSCEQTHITALAWDAEGRLLAGTSPDGILYRVEEKGKGRALYNSGEKEIKTIATREDGSVLFVTYTDSGKPAAESALAEKKDGDEKSGDSAETKSAKPASKGAGKLFMMDKQGFVEVLWRSSQYGIFAILDEGAAGILIGTNDDGKLFRFVNRNDWQLLQQAENGGEISALLPDPAQKGAALVVTSNPARVYRLGAALAEKGVFTSEVGDVQQIARWGKLQAVGDNDSPAGLAFRTRSGNTKEPDATWSDWAEAKMENGEAAVASPVARFLQYEATLPGKDAPHAGLRKVTIYFQTKNAAPAVNAIRFLPAGVELQKIEPPLRSLDLEQVLKTVNTEKLLQPPPPQTKLGVKNDEGFLTAAWDAADPNGDRLQFSLALKGDGDKDWITLLEDLDDPVAVINTKGLAEGHYRGKVTASDKPENPPDTALTGTLISELFLIDNAPPEITAEPLDIKKNKAVIKIKAADKFSVIKEGDYALDGKPAKNLFPDDGLFDSRTENFVLQLEKLEPGPHSLVIEIKDEGGRASVKTVSFQMEK